MTLARHAPAADSVTNRACIAFEAGGVLFGVAVDEVQEVLGVRPITRLFHAPAELAGVTSLRGDVLPVIDMSIVLACGSETSGPDARIVVVREAASSPRRAGLLVSRLVGLRAVPDAGLLPAPTTLSERVRPVVIGVIEDAPPCVVLSPGALFRLPAIGELGAEG